MEVKLDKRFPLDVGIEQAWAVLSDIRATAVCMPGAAITEQIDATHYKGTVKSKVGPAVMFFAGDIELLGRDAAKHAAECVTYALEQLVHISEDEHALVDGLRARAAPCSEGLRFGFGECTTNQRFRARTRTTTTSSSSLSMAHLAE